MRFPVQLLLPLALGLAVPLVAADFDHQHAVLTDLLRSRVTDNRVQYQVLHQDRRNLDHYLSQLESVTADEFKAFTHDQRFAFWINAYNAYTLRLIVDHYPVASIKKIGHFWQSPFKIEFIPLTVNGKDRLSLETIEHEILRKEFRDPRLHAAIVCASTSCPRLQPRAFTAAELDHQLTAAMSGFLADPTKNHWDAKTRTLHLSRIFEWFSEDFTRDGMTVVGFVARYSTTAVAAELTGGSAPRIAFRAYDWSLNGH